MNNSILGYIAINQYGETIQLTETKFPRKQLIYKTGETGKISKMFIDTISGETKHIGYIIGQNWWTIYNVAEWTGGNNA